MRKFIDKLFLAIVVFSLVPAMAAFAAGMPDVAAAGLVNTPEIAAPAAVANTPGALSLPDGLRMLFARSRDVAIAAQQQMAAGADVGIARSPMLPQVNSFFSHTELAYQPEALFGSFDVPESQRAYNEFNVSIHQLLFDFWGAASRVKASKSALEASREGTRRAKNLAAFRFVSGYLDLLQSQKMVLVAQRELARLRSHLSDASALYNGGVITKNDLLQAQVKIADVQQRLLNAQNVSQAAASRLNSMLSRPLDTPVIPVEVGQSEITAAMPADLKTVWGAALRQRPEILAEDSVLKSLGYEEKAYKSQYLPSLSISGGYDYTENKYMVHQGNLSAVALIRINLSNGGATKAEIRKLESRKAELVEQRDKLADQIGLEAENYFLDLSSSRQNLEAAKAALGQAQENVRINRVRYKEGVGTATEVLDSIALMTVAESNYYSAFYDLMRAQAGVLYSQGIDLTEVYK
ncbi:MAG: TolC family protein [Nitrospiraceae bacterium]|nr:TolC family protein [Nitrospiraceae bacterium]